MNSTQLRENFLRTFEEAGFRRTTALSLVQPSITTSFLFSVGFVDVMESIAGNSPEMDGAATVQRCFRHFDIERVTDGRHLSFFEMAGALKCNDWRVGDLVSPLIRFLVQECKLEKERLHVTYFGGGTVSGQVLEVDEQAREAYLAAGISAENLWAGDPTSNIWFEGANSGTERSGICGPHSEVFVDLHPERPLTNQEGPFSASGRFLEASNVVTITHHSRPDAEIKLIALQNPLVELAVGMERLEVAIAGTTNVFETPKLRSIADVITSPCDSDHHTDEIRIVVDHIRALTHLVADGARPGPKGRGHVIRRLFRRLLRASAALKLDAHAAFPELARAVLFVDDRINPNLTKNFEDIMQVFDREFRRMQPVPLCRS